MLCLNDSIRYDDPSLQRLLSAVEETHTLTARLLAVWPLARTLARPIVESVLAARAQAPTCWPPCPTCGTPLRSQGLATRQVTSLFATVDPDNARSVRLLLRLQFSEVTPAQYPHGEVELNDRVFMLSGGDTPRTFAIAPNQ